MVVSAAVAVKQFVPFFQWHPSWSKRRFLMRHVQPLHAGNLHGMYVYLGRTAANSPGEQAKQAQRLWDLMVPEKNWGLSHPFVPGLLFGIVALQLLISFSDNGESEEAEKEEVARLRAERTERRAAREAEAAQLQDERHQSAQR
mmetsp:Transcript_8725/g.16529  ORF Transcript_8725/g.16529 Transcript_8725/m.16529 type:complete len:144 (+) Transcript_8725:37-468(+)